MVWISKLFSRPSWLGFYISLPWILGFFIGGSSSSLTFMFKGDVLIIIIIIIINWVFKIIFQIQITAQVTKENMLLRMNLLVGMFFLQ